MGPQNPVLIIKASILSSQPRAFSLKSRTLNPPQPYADLNPKPKPIHIRA